MVTDPWTFAGEPTVKSFSGDSLTLVEGASFVISSAAGDIEPGSAQGLFFEDTRFLSTWRFRLDRSPPEHLTAIADQPFAATFVSRGRPRPNESDSTIFLERKRYVGNGMREDMVVRNFARESVGCLLSWELDVDFAHLFEVKENRFLPGRASGRDRGKRHQLLLRGRGNPSTH